MVRANDLALTGHVPMEGFLLVLSLRLMHDLSCRHLIGPDNLAALQAPEPELCAQPVESPVAGSVMALDGIRRISMPDTACVCVCVFSLSHRDLSRATRRFATSSCLDPDLHFRAVRINPLLERWRPE